LPVRLPCGFIAGVEEIARHDRSYDTGQMIEQEAHVAGLVAATRQANPSSARDRLRLAVPAVATLLDRLAARGESLRVHTARLLALLDDYGPQELGAAIALALERDALGAGAIAHLLETRRRQQGLKPPIPLALPDRPGVRDLDVTPHRLETYDDLTRSDPDVGSGTPGWGASRRWQISTGRGRPRSIVQPSSASSPSTF
jgi:hypothetical protein